MRKIESVMKYLKLKAIRLVILVIACCCYDVFAWVQGPPIKMPLSKISISNQFPKSPSAVIYPTSKVQRKRSVMEVSVPTEVDRFDKTASTDMSINDECILTIFNNTYNLTTWAAAHPGGTNILLRLNGKNATNAFIHSGHSETALNMLENFVINGEKSTYTSNVSERDDLLDKDRRTLSLKRIKKKLFTNEDPGIHKYCGLFVLLHFAYRYYQSYFEDVYAGFGPESSIKVLLYLVPHTVLSLSSVIFKSVPRERVVGSPMIWREFRAHNIIFAMRSIICTSLAWQAIHYQHLRKVSMIGCALTILMSIAGADIATAKLRDNENESTTATMPYWPGCSISTQRRFKSFYAFSQFMATWACLVPQNPVWPLTVLFPIQLASLLMTLVRKGFISARGYHLLYTASLSMPYFTALRSYIYNPSFSVPLMSVLAFATFQLRRRGVNKYALWGGIATGRVCILLRG